MAEIVDGNNLIGRLGGGTREGLVSELCEVARRKRKRLTVVFDGPPEAGRAKVQALGDVQVVYAAPRSADEEIVRRIREARDPRGVTVVTDDRALRLGGRGGGGEDGGDRAYSSGTRPRGCGRRRRPRRESLPRPATRRTGSAGSRTRRTGSSDGGAPAPGCRGSSPATRSAWRRSRARPTRSGSRRASARWRASGYRVRLAPNALAKEPLLGLAGNAEERAAGYRALLLDDAVKAIVFSRGGYGVAPALEHLDPAEAARHPKIHCGFSDVTLLSAWLLRAGVPSFHGPMVAADLARGLDPLSASFFPAMLEGRGPKTILLEGEEGIAGAPADGSSSGCVLVPGSASGTLVGGCLSLLAASVGTPYEFDYDGGLLFFEDISEEAYRIDRMLGTLIDSGRFAKLSGILIGTLSVVTFGGVEDAERLRSRPRGPARPARRPRGHRSARGPPRSQRDPARRRTRRMGRQRGRSPSSRRS